MILGQIPNPIRWAQNKWDGLSDAEKSGVINSLKIAIETIVAVGLAIASLSHPYMEPVVIFYHTYLLTKYSERFGWPATWFSKALLIAHGVNAIGISHHIMRLEAGR